MNKKGKITQLIGAVVDVSFEGDVPEIYTALEVNKEVKKNVYQNFLLLNCCTWYIYDFKCGYCKNGINNVLPYAIKFILTDIDDTLTSDGILFCNLNNFINLILRQFRNIFGKINC